MNKHLHCQLDEGKATCSTCDFLAANPSHPAHAVLRSTVAPVDPTDCVRRGASLRVVDCPTCGGSVKAKTFACATHGECTLFTKPIPGIKACDGCTDYQAPKMTTVNMGAGGLGDALLGLVATKGLQASGTKVSYAVHPDAIPFVRLFDGWDEVVTHVHDSNKDEPPPGGADYQLNLGYNLEVRTKAATPRWERYCANAGGVKPILPVLRDRARLRARGQPYAGCVAVAPFGAWVDRLWRIESWRTLIRLLKEAGHRVVVLDKSEGQCKTLDCEYLAGASAEWVASVLLNARCLIGLDSGPLHFAGCLGVPGIGLFGKTAGKDIFGLYPSIQCVQGVLDCDGCWWQAPYRDQHCKTTCASMGTILPADIVARVGKLPDTRRKIDRIKDLIPFGAFTSAQAAAQAQHLSEDDYLYRAGKHRYECSLLGTLYEELRTSRPDLAKLVLETCWMARMMHDRGMRQEDIDWTSVKADGHVGGADNG